MNILFYFPSNRRAIAIETPILALQEKGHKLSLLTIVDSYGPLHEALKAKGVTVDYYVIRRKNLIMYYLKHFKFIIQYSKKNNIDIIFSHIQYVNIISVIAQYFTKTKFILFRHHDYPKNSKERITDWIINRLATTIVIPAQSIKKRMIENEGVNTKKIKVIPYIYNFDEYSYSLDKLLTENIKKTYHSKLLLVMVSRIVPEKRHFYAVKVINELIKKGLDVKLLILDEGSEKNKIMDFVKINNLQNNIFFLGFQKNVMSYLDSADALLHPSIAEASCSVVKEAGLLKKTVIICKGVGDFDDYIINNKNGIFVEQTDNGDQLTTILTDLYNNKEAYYKLGPTLREDILNNFSVNEKTTKMYLDLLNG